MNDNKFSPGMGSGPRPIPIASKTVGPIGPGPIDVSGTGSGPTPYNEWPDDELRRLLVNISSASEQDPSIGPQDVMTQGSMSQGIWGALDHDLLVALVESITGNPNTNFGR